MRKLFRAAFYRTENKKMIRIELVIAVLLSAYIILNGYFQTNLTNAYIYKLVARFFGYSPLMGPFIAVFASTTVSCVTLIFANTSAVVAEIILYSRFMESSTRARVEVSVTSMRTQLTVVLAKENCEVLSMQEKDESLESYYISLVGGDNNA